MKTMREMSRQHSDMVPVSFHDVAACFSEEEWKLFNEWQRELYENLMKEIHQVLISLGPLIATSVFSLRPKGKEDLFPMDLQDSAIRDSINCFPSDEVTNSDVLMRKEIQANQYSEAIQETSQREIHYCSSTVTGHALIKPDVPFIIKERDTYSIDHQDSNRREHINSGTGSAAVAPVSSFSNKDEGQTYSMDQQHSDRWKGISSPTKHTVNMSVVTFKIKEEGESCCDNYQDSETREAINIPTEHEDRTPIVPLIIKEDGRTYSMSHEVSETQGSINTPTGKQAAKRRKERDSVNCTEKLIPCKPSSGKAKENVFQSSEMAANSRRQLRSESYQEWGGEKSISWDTVFMKETPSIAHQGSVESVRADAYNECESNMSSGKCDAWPQNTLGHGRQYTSAECEQSVIQKGSGIEDQGSHSGLRVVNPKQTRHHQGTESKKIFSWMKNRIGHPRTHFIERPYSCTKCDKCFSQIANRNRHQSTHSEERSYQCSECDKSFNRKDNLARHQRSHTKDSTLEIQN